MRMRDPCIEMHPTTPFYFERKPILFKRQNTERARLAMGKSTFGWLCMTLLCPQNQQD